MSDINEIMEKIYHSRISKTKSLIECQGIRSYKQLALESEVDHSQITRAMNKEVPFTEKNARKIECAYNLPILSLDTTDHIDSIEIFLDNDIFKKSLTTMKVPYKLGDFGVKLTKQYNAYLTTNTIMIFKYESDILKLSNGSLCLIEVNEINVIAYYDVGVFYSISGDTQHHGEIVNLVSSCKAVFYN
ncbi:MULTISPECIES: hypothetical protein [Cysteiniphilum]|uniref:Uncharacterized protein n=1 Tax=Cysteiniphilum litorale TaxID=2056700 RepID=A0A8J2Z6K7_9GAMM|nr:MULTISPECIES: hypothetical protein [Cysteiniphilum]GGG05869.1 hypothetical protein GCM10010995_24220 [Cysteiniphilum litorale]